MLFKQNVDDATNDRREDYYLVLIYFPTGSSPSNVNEFYVPCGCKEFELNGMGMIFRISNSLSKREFMPDPGYLRCQAAFGTVLDNVRTFLKLIVTSCFYLSQKFPSVIGLIRRARIVYKSSVMFKFTKYSRTTFQFKFKSEACKVKKDITQGLISDSLLSISLLCQIMCTSPSRQP